MTTKARLVEVTWNEQQRQYEPVPPPRGKALTVHFNPESLKVAFASENRGGNQANGRGGQFVGSGTSTLSVELVFDTTENRGDQVPQDGDVRRITQDVAYFVKPKDSRGQQRGRNTSSNRVPPMISFEWGTFLFRGIADSMDETLDYFSETGVPMRATVSLNISRQEIEFQFGTPGPAGPGPAGGAGAAARGTPGTQPVDTAQPGDSVQKMAARQGRSSDWKSIAAANNIDNPLRLSAGTTINMNAGAGADAGLAAGAQAGFSAGLGGGVGFAADAGASAGLGASAGASAGLGASAGASAGFGAGTSASANFSAGSSISATAAAFARAETRVD